MKYNISGFTHIGTKREINQDRILIQDRILCDGAYSVKDVENCFCFVTDGIGGGPAGEYAAQFVLEQISSDIISDSNYSDDEFLQIFSSINNKLLESGRVNYEYRNSGTTLVGLMIHQGSFNVITAGDSPAYLFRNNSMIKITEDHVLDPFEENSPITSYFGGKSDELRLSLKTVLREIEIDDILILSSDGLLEALSIKQIKAILLNSKTISEKARFILKKAVEAGADDNISCILIKVMGN